MLVFPRKLRTKYPHRYLLRAHTRKGLRDRVQVLKAVLWTADPSSPLPHLLCEFMLFLLTHLKFSLYQRNFPIPHEMPLFSLQYLLRRMDWMQKDHGRHVKTYPKSNLSLHSLRVELKAFLFWLLGLNTCLHAVS